MGQRILIFLIVTYFAPAFAMETLSFDECVKESLEANPELLAAQRLVQSNQFQVRASYFNFFPQVSGNLSLDYSNATNSTITASRTNGWNFQSTLQAKQNFFSGFADKARVDLAAANRQSAEADLETIKAKISLELKSAFAGLRYAQDLVELTDDIIKRREANLKLISLSFDSGRENKGSVSLSSAYLEQARLENFQARNALSLASVRLAKVLGRDASDDLRVSGTLALSMPPLEPDFNELALLTPSYLKFEAQEKAAVASRLSARAGFFPSVDFASTFGANSDFSNSNLFATVGLSVGIPIFNGGRDFYGYRAANQSLIAASYTKRKVQTEATTQLASAYFAFAESIQRVHADRSFLEAQVTREKIARAEYNNGLITFFAWDLIENDFIARQKAVLASEQNRIVAEATWENAQGLGVIP